MSNLNKNEQAVVDCINNCGDEFDDRMTMNGSDISVDGLTKNQIKGYLSDLMKKDIIKRQLALYKEAIDQSTQDVWLSSYAYDIDGNKIDSCSAHYIQVKMI